MQIRSNTQNMKKGPSFQANIYTNPIELGKIPEIGQSIVKAVREVNIAREPGDVLIRAGEKGLDITTIQLVENDPFKRSLSRDALIKYEDLAGDTPIAEKIQQTVVGLNNFIGGFLFKAKEVLQDADITQGTFRTKKINKMHRTLAKMTVKAQKRNEEKQKIYDKFFKDYMDHVPISSRVNQSYSSSHLEYIKSVEQREQKNKNTPTLPEIQLFNHLSTKYTDLLFSNSWR